MKTNFVGIIGLLFTCTSLGIIPRADAAPSSYQKTCSQISIAGNQLSAICKTRNGSLNQTSLTLRGIENIDGNLKVTNPNKVSSYQNSCPEIGINGRRINATCKRRDGSLKRTSIVLNGIENIDGFLKYTSSP
ncbi:hypothetical protein H6G81_09840 [Scytonema hofmannii FACHB-248]|uniref:Cyanovirin-N domain-containing protein n=1 Tax=Scytonema hofmannii FACHB-248 TaxID=1842502 RepID=A0ABR8GNA2_9CYAN|nr:MULTISPECIES: CVNH domain-containing protein [Nostocales]MBD2604818.1 hypothetical protein [Scytonema hofmannii FACHB-248]